MAYHITLPENIIFRARRVAEKSGLVPRRVAMERAENTGKHHAER